MESGNGAGVGKPCVLVFGGTTEGRLCAEWLGRRGTCSVVVSSLTEYGGSLVRDVPNVESLTGKMPPEAIERLLRERAFTCVVDATHPYAAGVSESIRNAAQACDVALCRILREGGFEEGNWIVVENAEEAARVVAGLEGRVLLTTGSKDLPVYTKVVPDFAERLYVRVLPVASSVSAAQDLGIPVSHIIAMQGPFGVELNSALIREYGIETMVTKNSGEAGGFKEKARAAQECAITLVVVSRPPDSEGYTLEQAKQYLMETFGL